MGLPDGRKSFQIGLALQTQYWRVSDRRVHRQTHMRHLYDSKDRAMQSVARVKSAHIHNNVVSTEYAVITKPARCFFVYSSAFAEHSFV